MAQSAGNTLVEEMPYQAVAHEFQDILLVLLPQVLGYVSSISGTGIDSLAKESDPASWIPAVGERKADDALASRLRVMKHASRSQITTT